jgi:hypothetical protein
MTRYRPNGKYAYVDLGTGALYVEKGYALFSLPDARARVRALRTRGYKKAKAVVWTARSPNLIRGMPQVTANPRHNRR